MKKIRFFEARSITAALAAAGIAVIAAYIYCDTSCTYLNGSIFGLDIKYLGLMYMGLILLLCLAGREKSLTLLLSFGMGSEVFLVGYQVTSSVYCPYCLAFAAIILLMFVLNFKRGKGLPMAVSSVAGFVFFVLFFFGSVTPAYGEENAISSFGSGRVTVRLYTDYFCGPCNSLEGKLEGVIVELVQKKIIRITFIDTPIHKETPLYAKYFLYVLNEKRDFKHALLARAVLFEAAAANIIHPGELESFLTKRGIGYRIFDVKPVFDRFERHIREDGITSTPTCVISTGNEPQKFKGAEKILEALNGYRNKK
jgi:thiol:disulfide interchange protein DsbA